MYSVSKKDNVDLYKAFAHLLSKEPMKEIEIPKSVEISMEDKVSKTKKKLVKVSHSKKKKNNFIDLTEEEDDDLKEILENLTKPNSPVKKRKIYDTSDLLKMKLDFE